MVPLWEYDDYLKSLNEWESSAFVLNLFMAILNTILCYTVSKFFWAHSLVRFESQAQLGLLPTLQESSEWSASISEDDIASPDHKGRGKYLDGMIEMRKESF